MMMRVDYISSTAGCVALRAILSQTLTYIVLHLMLTASVVHACDIDGKSGILPPNTMRVNMFTKSANSIDENTFNAIISRVEKVYAPIVAQKGGQLSIERRWNDDTVNAFADRQGTTWSLHMFGGLARHPAVTMDAFMLVVCHELGHQIGGAPKKDGPDSWAANEGQADYWGSMKCLRRVMTESPEIARPFAATNAIDSAVKAGCLAAHRDNADQVLCERIGMAGKSLANLFAAFGGPIPKVETPDPSVVSVMFNDHPKPQCRLDTYIEGSLCNKPYLDDVDDKDPKRGVCDSSDGYKVGIRPLCWYKPADAQSFR